VLTLSWDATRDKGQLDAPAERTKGFRLHLGGITRKVRIIPLELMYQTFGSRATGQFCDQIPLLQVIAFGSRGIRQFCDQVPLLQIIPCVCLHIRKVEREIKIHIFVSVTSK
jgi:hypothetical protein